MSADHFVSVTLFDRDGATPLKRLHRAYSMQWLDENDAPGSFSFTIPAEDDAQVAIGRIVKFSYGTRSDAYRWAGVIESITHRLTDDLDVVQVAGRGVRALLEGAVVYQGANEADQVRSFTDAYPSAIMRTFLSEAHDRGTITEITAGFTNNADSLGVAFDTDTDMTVDVEVGTSLADVADQHQEAVLDSVWVNADLELEYAITRGTDTTATSDPVVFRAMENLVSFEKKVDGPVRNVTLISYDDGEDLTEKVSTLNTVSTYGRREQFLDLNNVGNATKAERYANKMMKTSADPTDGATAEVTDDGVKPYIDYGIGDYVWVVAKNGARTKYRIRTITVTADGDGNVRIVPELGTVQANLDERLRKALKRLESRNAKGDASSLTPPQSGLTSTVPSGTLVIGNPVGGEFVYQSPSLKADVIALTNDDTRPSLVPNGLQDTGNALGTGVDAVLQLSGNSIVSYNTTDGVISRTPLPTANATPAYLSRWGNRILTSTRGSTVGTFVNVIENGMPRLVTLADIAGYRLLGVGGSADGTGLVGVWGYASGTSLGTLIVVKYDDEGVELGRKSGGTFGGLSSGLARVENGFVVVHYRYSTGLGTIDKLLLTRADLTDPVEDLGTVDITSNTVNPGVNSLSLGTISTDGFVWAAGDLNIKNMYRVNCNARTLDIFPDAFSGPEDNTTSVLSVSATKAVWLGRTTGTATYTQTSDGQQVSLTTYKPVIANIVLNNGVINFTRSELEGGNTASSASFETPSGITWASVGTLTSSGDVVFHAFRAREFSNVTPRAGAYSRILRVAGP